MQEFLISIACFLAGAVAGGSCLLIFSCLKIAKDADKKLGADEMDG